MAGRDAGDYVRIAQGLAADVQALNRLRLGLRDAMEASALMREDLFNHSIAEGLRAMWIQWAARGLHPGAPDAQHRRLKTGCPICPKNGRQSNPRCGLGNPASGSACRGPPALAVIWWTQPRPPPPAVSADTEGCQITDSHWIAVTELAETVLLRRPNDPGPGLPGVEVEVMPTATPEFAVTYLQHATQAMGIVRWHSPDARAHHSKKSYK